MNRTNKIATVVRVLLGLAFSASGLNHLFALVPMPAMAGDTARFWQGLAGTSYFFPLLGAVELCAGLLLLSGRGLPLALALLAPVRVNVALFHAVLAPQAMGMVVGLVAASGFLAWRNRAAFAGVLRARAAASSTGVRIAEVVLGLAFVASGVAGFLGRTPPPATAGAALMMEGFAAAGYFFPMLAGVQVLAGAALVARRFVPLALGVLAPVVVEILAYRLWVAAARPAMVLVAVALVALEAWLAFAHRDAFIPLVGGGRPASPVPAGARVSLARG